MKKFSLRILFACNFALIACLVLMGLKQKKNQQTVELESLVLKSPHSKATLEIGFKGDTPSISLKDDSQKTRMELLGGDFPGLFLKNAQNQTIASFAFLADGGAGAGFANKEGKAVSILKGGDTPAVIFFGNEKEPSAALGVMQHVPHLMISSKDEHEGVLIHGGEPSGMMVMDEKGQLKIFISKHGVYQGKEEEEQVEKKEKFFSLDEDVQSLFNR